MPQATEADAQLIAPDEVLLPAWLFVQIVSGTRSRGPWAVAARMAVV